jgi:hypothetical protein
VSIFRIEWGGWDDDGEASVSAVAELDAVLDRVEASRDNDGYPFKVGIFAEGIRHGPLPVGVEITLGHPERASVFYVGPDGTASAYDPDTPPWSSGPVWFNANGVPTDYGPDRLRLTPKQAREAAREFVRTGKRPGNARWQRAE